METTEPEVEEPESTEAESTETETAEAESTEPEVAEVESTEPEVAEVETTEAEPAEAETTKLESAEAETTDTETTEPQDTKLEDQKTKVPIFKRILLYAAMVISVLFLLLSLAGIIGGWALNKPATEAALTVLTSFDNALQRIEEASAKTGAALSEISTALDDADQQIQEAGEELADTNLLLEVISLLIGEDIEPNTDQAGESIRSIYDTVLAIEEAIAAINAIPFLNIEIPGEEEIASIRTGMEEMAVAVSELKEEVQQRREDRAENLVEAISAPINRLNTRVEELQTRMADIEQRSGMAIERIDQVQSRVPLWIDLVSIANTLLFGWFMFSQGAVIVLFWRALHPNQAAAAK